MPNTDCFEKLPKPALGEPYLLTPGPLTTAYEVKQEMLKDCSLEEAYIAALPLLTSSKR